MSMVWIRLEVGVESQGVDDKCTRQIVVFETNQPNLGVSMEEGGAISEVACMGEEESLTNCEPLSSIAPLGLELSMEMYKDNEVLGLGSKLDVSSWVKHRIPGFSKVVGLSVNRHERLCIDYLQRLEREMEVVIERRKKATANQKATSSTGKGKRELRNLISSINYDGREGVGSVVEEVVEN